MLRTAAKALLLVALLTTQAVSLPNGAPEIRQRPGTGNFLLLSDVHFDPFTDPAIVEQLGAKPLPACQTPASIALSPLGGDTNYPLLKSTIENIKATAESKHLHYDYVILTGDILAHEFDSKYQKCVNGDAAAYQKFTSDTIKFVDDLIVKALPRVPVFVALGNNDTDRGDYAEPSQAFLRSVGQGWSSEWGKIPTAARQSAVESFERGGFYSVPNPVVARDELVILDSDPWVARNSTACSAGNPDPGGEFAWMEQVLSGLKREQRTATVIMHVLPGIDALRSSLGEPQPLWTPACIQKFIGDMTDFRGVVREIYAGHIHRDDFRILPDREGKPLLPIHVAPSVSPVYFNNPAVEVGWYDKSTGELADYAPLYLDLANYKTTWAVEYVFSRAYGRPRPNLAALVDLGREIHEGSPESGVGREYANFYNVGVGLFLTTKNWRNFTCTQTTFTPVLFAQCKNSRHDQ